ncbi:restriction endonuclease subunit S [Acinetobacter bouvetii]|uniref:EcoKI restriction-modification system protein HsdS n=1 Tax=Acinetobacter bouvetii TaxID=202951 RepID=A0A811G704_9GAMM|nr:restriction endonuclease subunit S [Acinetobacter bouvetii]CAB1207540.1 EcoKI restriction-modification system protein HsdS [Acinetobacter bouvetii]
MKQIKVQLQLKDITEINAGYSFRGKIPEVEGSSIVVVQMKDVSVVNGIDWSHCIGTELTGKKAPDWLQATDILVAARGNHYYAVQVGESAWVEQQQAVAAPHFFVVRIIRQDVLPEYLTWLLNQNPCQKFLEQNSEGSMAKSIRRSVLEATPIAVPPLAKQQAIIGIAKAFKQEQQLVEQLLRNGEQLMTTIATDLLSQKIKH